MLLWEDSKPNVGRYHDSREGGDLESLALVLRIWMTVYYMLYILYNPALWTVSRLLRSRLGAH